MMPTLTGAPPGLVMRTASDVSICHFIDPRIGELALVHAGGVLYLHVQINRGVFVGDDDALAVGHARRHCLQVHAGCGADGDRPGDGARLGDLDNRDDDVLVVKKVARENLDRLIGVGDELEQVVTLVLLEGPFDAAPGVEVLPVVEGHFESAFGLHAGESAAVGFEDLHAIGQEIERVRLDEVWFGLWEFVNGHRVNV